MKTNDLMKPHPTRRNQAWAIDFARLDLDRRPLVMMVIDGYTHRLLSAAVKPAIVEGIAIGLMQLVRRSGRPHEIWIDHEFDHSCKPLRSWAEEHRISVTRVPMIRMKALTEPIARDLVTFLHDKRLTRRIELDHEIERWRQSYTIAVRPLPKNADQ